MKGDLVFSFCTSFLSFPRLLQSLVSSCPGVVQSMHLNINPIKEKCMEQAMVSVDDNDEKNRDRLVVWYHIIYG